MSDEITFVDGHPSCNYYDPIGDFILIDSNLDDYPLAKEYVIEHESRHQKYRTDLIDDLIHEFKNDWFMEFSLSKEAVELREYSNDSLEGLSGFFYFKMFVMKMLRNTWSLFLVPAGSIYRKVVKNITGR